MAHDFDIRIAKLPKVELHLHLEGSIRRQTIQELARRFDTSFSVDDAAWAHQAFQYNGLSHFITIVRTLLATCLRRPEDYERIAYELFVDLADQNVRYAEISFDPSRGLSLAISFDEMLTAINASRERIMSEQKIRIGLIVGLGRERGPDIVTEFARKAADAKMDGIVGIDLHGDEGAFAPEEFVEAFDIARTAGLGLRAHAGEAAGAPSIWGAIRSLGVSRIAHGIRAIEDPALLEYLRGYPITLDVSPTSNFKLGIISNLSEHPIRRLFDLGIRVTVNSDDPLFFDTTISKEYQYLRQYLGFSYDELKQIGLYAVEGAFLSEEEKTRLRHEIEYEFDTE